MSAELPERGGEPVGVPAARHGFAVPRGQQARAGDEPPAGRFGRMFPDLCACAADPDALERLVGWMKQRRVSRDNQAMPAGMTYLAQFVDHDITFDPLSKLGRPNDPHRLVNFRTPRLDLDSVYGGGPLVQPFLYDWTAAEGVPAGTKLLVGENSSDPAWAGTPAERAREDLQRNSQGRALIGDARNDENAIVAQLHLLFIKFHNAVVDRLVDDGTVPQSELWDTAQRLVRWHYQWIVARELLPKIVGEQTAAAVLTPPSPGAVPVVRREHYVWDEEPFIPIEFSGAAYRFGHSMVRNAYGIKRRTGTGTPRALDLFPDLQGFRWLRQEIVIDWERFFVLPGAPPRTQRAFLIDTSITKPLFALPDTPQPLPLLNLLRGHALGLPSGQAVADAMGEHALSPEQLQLDDTIDATARAALLESTPLWFYILCEAATVLDPVGGGGGLHLGPVGGQIVGEVLVGLIEGDPESFLAIEPTWRPSYGQNDDFTMADLVMFSTDQPRPLDGDG